MKLIVTLILVIGACGAIFYCNKNRNDLRNNGKLTVGRVTRAYGATKGGIYIDYEFNVAGQTIHGGALYYISSRFVGLFENKTFPVIYSASYPARNMMLILRSNFSDYGLTCPDSLLWVTRLHSL